MDSHRKRSMLQGLSFVCPMKVNHDGTTRPRPVMCSQDSPDEVFVDICLECLVDLLSDSEAAKARVALL